MSRSRAKRTINGRDLKNSLEKQKGIVVIADSMPGLAEEAPQAYKNVNDVVQVVHQAGISKKVAKMKPLGVVKG